MAVRAALGNADVAVRVHRVACARSERGLIEVDQRAVQRSVVTSVEGPEEPPQPRLLRIVGLCTLVAPEDVRTRLRAARELAVRRFPAVARGEGVVVPEHARAVVLILGVEVVHLSRVDDRILRPGPEIDGLAAQGALRVDRSGRRLLIEVTL